jgi:hypothetical protein
MKKASETCAITKKRRRKNIPLVAQLMDCNSKES